MTNIKDPVDLEKDETALWLLVNLYRNDGQTRKSLVGGICEAVKSILNERPNHVQNTLDGLVTHHYLEKKNLKNNNFYTLTDFGIAKMDEKFFNPIVNTIMDQNVAIVPTHVTDRISNEYKDLGNDIVKFMNEKRTWSRDFIIRDLAPKVIADAMFGIIIQTIIHALK